MVSTRYGALRANSASSKIDSKIVYVLRGMLRGMGLENTLAKPPKSILVERQMRLCKSTGTL